MQKLVDYVAGKSVALVGNAESILAGDFGAEIDEHDVVVRMNLGLPRSLPRDAVGERTSLWATAKHWTGMCPKDADWILFMKLTELGDKHWHALMKEDLPVPSIRWPKELEAECKAFVGADPGTGVRVLWWLKTYCKPRIVQVYGVDCWATRSHWSGKRNTPNHDPEKERDAFRRLMAQ